LLVVGTGLAAIAGLDLVEETSAKKHHKKKHKHKGGNHKNRDKKQNTDGCNQYDEYCQRACPSGTVAMCTAALSGSGMAVSCFPVGQEDGRCHCDGRAVPGTNTVCNCETVNGQFVDKGSCSWSCTPDVDPCAAFECGQMVFDPCNQVNNCGTCPEGQWCSDELGGTCQGGW
jgi:hypothetical protein